MRFKVFCHPPSESDNPFFPLSKAIRDDLDQEVSRIPHFFFWLNKCIIQEFKMHFFFLDNYTNW